MSHSPLHELHAVDADVRRIHDALENWARWARPHDKRRTSAMFRLYKPYARGRAEYCATPPPAIEVGEAQQIEQIVARLHARAPLHAEALRWYYVRDALGAEWLPRLLGRRLADMIGVSLAGLLREARLQAHDERRIAIGEARLGARQRHAHAGPPLDKIDVLLVADGGLPRSALAARDAGGDGVSHGASPPA